MKSFKIFECNECHDGKPCFIITSNPHMHNKIKCVITEDNDACWVETKVTHITLMRIISFCYGEKNSVEIKENKERKEDEELVDIDDKGNIRKRSK